VTVTVFSIELEEVMVAFPVSAADRIEAAGARVVLEVMALEEVVESDDVIDESDVLVETPGTVIDPW